MTTKRPPTIRLAPKIKSALQRLDDDQRRRDRADAVLERRLIALSLRGADAAARMRGLAPSRAGRAAAPPPRAMRASDKAANAALAKPTAQKSALAESFVRSIARKQRAEFARLARMLGAQRNEEP